jgi:hypothetical protein
MFFDVPYLRFISISYSLLLSVSPELLLRDSGFLCSFYTSPPTANPPNSGALLTVWLAGVIETYCCG